MSKRKKQQSTGRLRMPEDYFTAEHWCERTIKRRSGYYVRDKGYEDGDACREKCPPAREGYYHDEYMRSYECGSAHLPF